MQRLYLLLATSCGGLSLGRAYAGYQGAGWSAKALGVLLLLLCAIALLLGEPRRRDGSVPRMVGRGRRRTICLSLIVVIFILVQPTWTARSIAAVLALYCALVYGA